jgi:hypothetical protein
MDALTAFTSRRNFPGPPTCQIPRPQPRPAPPHVHDFPLNRQNAANAPCVRPRSPPHVGPTRVQLWGTGRAPAQTADGGVSPPVGPHGGPPGPAQHHRNPIQEDAGDAARTAGPALPATARHEEGVTTSLAATVDPLGGGRLRVDSSGGAGPLPHQGVGRARCARCDVDAIGPGPCGQKDVPLQVCAEGMNPPFSEDASGEAPQVASSAVGLLHGSDSGQQESGMSDAGPNAARLQPWTDGGRGAGSLRGPDGRPPSVGANCGPGACPPTVGVNCGPGGHPRGVPGSCSAARHLMGVPYGLSPCHAAEGRESVHDVQIVGEHHAPRDSGGQNTSRRLTWARRSIGPPLTDRAHQGTGQGGHLGGVFPPQGVSGREHARGIPEMGPARPYWGPTGRGDPRRVGGAASMLLPEMRTGNEPDSGRNVLVHRW